MSGPSRVAQGGEIDRGRPIAFSFDGRAYSGFAGDTVASALLANGVRIVGRSFKYHRPRGIFSAGVEEPNAILDLVQGERRDPNARATLEPLVEGMALRSIHAKGTADRDRLATAGYVSQYIPLFAMPGPDGRASDKKFEGSVKGDGAVANIAPRLRALLRK